MSPNPHDFIQFPFHVIADVFAKTAPLYAKGLSLTEIEHATGFTKSVVRRQLLIHGVPLRSTRTEIKSKGWRKIGTSSSKPPFGFCYFEGRLVRHPNEYPTLQLIHRQWKSGLTANAIATWLNGKRIPSPMKKKWSWNSVTNVIKRFKNKTVISKGGQFKLR